jgi:acyl-coenzyme A thioesterase PaaI-like protein
MASPFSGASRADPISSRPRDLSFEERRRVAHFCFACGRDNPSGLKLEVRVEDGRAIVDFDPAPIHQGFPGHMHGGLLATLLDEVMAWAIYASGSWAVTARMEIRFRDPAPLDQRLRAVGWVTRKRRRSFEAAGHVEGADGAVLAEGSGIFMPVPLERMPALEDFDSADRDDPR